MSHASHPFKLTDGTECQVIVYTGFVVRRTSDPQVLTLRDEQGQENQFNVESLAPLDGRLGHELGLAFVKAGDNGPQWLAGARNHKTGQTRRTLEMAKVFEGVVQDPMHGYVRSPLLTTVLSISAGLAIAAGLTLMMLEIPMRNVIAWGGWFSALTALATGWSLFKAGIEYKTRLFTGFEQQVSAAATQLMMRGNSPLNVRRRVRAAPGAVVAEAAVA
jgi:hypothetical protein